MRYTKLLFETGAIDLTFAGDISIGNVSGRSTVYAVPSDELTDVDGIEDLALRNGIFNAMYGLKPGERRTLPKGQYQIILGGDAKAFLTYSGNAQRVKPAKAAPAPETV